MIVTVTKIDIKKEQTCVIARLLSAYLNKRGESQALSGVKSHYGRVYGSSRRLRLPKAVFITDIDKSSVSK